VIDTRTEAGTRALFGGTNPAAVLYTRESYIARNPGTMQALTNAFYKALIFIQASTPEQIAAVMPPEYLLGDRPLYISALTSSKPTYSHTGVITEAGMKSANDMLLRFDEQVKGAKFDLAKTFDDRFVKKAAATIK
jgi:NitT/TauT family transport system substrate-binding protein